MPHKGSKLTPEQKQAISERTKAYWAKIPKKKRIAMMSARINKVRAHNERSEKMKLAWAKRKQAQLQLPTLRENTDALGSMKTFSDMMRALSTLIETPQNAEQAKVVIDAMRTAVRYLVNMFDLNKE